MSDPNQPPQPLWLRALSNQRFKALLTLAVTGSGFFGLGIVHRWFPDLTPSEFVQDVIYAAPFVVSGVVEWYRNHPDNILARATKVINGGTASPAAVAKVEAAVTP